MDSIKGRVHSIESFGSADGPGVRFLVFLQGCNMRCQYCHNPDTWDYNTGQTMEASEIIKKALRYKPYWKNGGGITVSGGEALLQIDFLIELFTLAKAAGINTCLDTSGNLFTKEGKFFEKFNILMKVTDLFLLDIKQIDDHKHEKLTGHSNKNILAMASYLSAMGKSMWIRHVLVPGITDGDEDLYRLKSFIDKLQTVEKIEILPYHTLGVFKWKAKGYDYPLDKVEPPTQASIDRARSILGIK